MPRFSMLYICYVSLICSEDTTYTVNCRPSSAANPYPLHDVPRCCLWWWSICHRILLWIFHSIILAYLSLVRRLWKAHASSNITFSNLKLQGCSFGVLLWWSDCCRDSPYTGYRKEWLPSVKTEVWKPGGVSHFMTLNHVLANIRSWNKSFW